ncbi:hypothetical protein R3P38DRAFT_3217979 [Favolaschia claudopus]|uniref:Secreted protein n=1 Tax=Favolaschia claudopus TaxID=2862362 RepID=A0AAW0A406_9AGAR
MSNRSMRLSRLTLVLSLCSLFFTFSSGFSDAEHFNNLLFLSRPSLSPLTSFYRSVILSAAMPSRTLRLLEGARNECGGVTCRLLDPTRHSSLKRASAIHAATAAGLMFALQPPARSIEEQQHHRRPPPYLRITTYWVKLGSIRLRHLGALDVT